MELVNSGGTEPDCDSTSGATMETIPTPDPTDEDAFLQLSQNSIQQTASFPKDSLSRSSASATSAGSSVDMESSIGTDNWNLQTLFTKAQRLFSMYGGLRGGAGEAQERAVEEGEDEIIMTEPGRDDTRFIEYPFHSQEGVTMTYKEVLNSELKDKFATSLCVRGSSLTPEPITSASLKKVKGHKRTPTWHDESQLNHRSRSPAKTKKSDLKTLRKLTPYVVTPRMHANLRVQPHPLKGLRHALMPDYKPLNKTPSEKRVFDIFVHPSTLPEVYHYLKKKSTSGSFLVELSPIPQLNKYILKVEPGSKPDGAPSDGNNGNGTSPPRNSDTSLPASLVVRLCFATHVTVQGDDMTASLSETPREVVLSVGGGGEEGDKEEPLMSVPVRVGQVLMSDLVCQQLEIKECSRVKILHVMDSWRISFVDGIKVVVQPINYEKVGISEPIHS